MAYHAIRGLCDCGKPVRSKGRTITGLQMWDKRCWMCRCGGY